jgi:hypothetical protein
MDKLSNSTQQNTAESLAYEEKSYGIQLKLMLQNNRRMKSLAIKR